MKLAALSGRLSGALVALTLCLTAACATPSSQEVAVGTHRVVDTGHYGSESLRVTLSDPFEGCEWQASSQGFACEGVGFSFGNVDDTAPFDSLLIALLGGLEAATGTELETSIDRLDSLPEGAELARKRGNGR